MATNGSTPCVYPLIEEVGHPANKIHLLFEVGHPRIFHQVDEIIHPDGSRSTKTTGGTVTFQPDPDGTPTIA